MKITLSTKKRMYREAEQWADYLHSNPSYWASRKSEYIETVRSRYLTALSYALKFFSREAV
jgi:hypothetical protein